MELAQLFQDHDFQALLVQSEQDDVADIQQETYGYTDNKPYYSIIEKLRVTIIQFSERGANLIGGALNKQG